MSAHRTPGPWRQLGREVYGANGARVAEDVNAHDMPLVLAAPDLSAALEACRTELWRLLDVKGVHPKDARQWPEVAAADAALAKAGGPAVFTASTEPTFDAHTEAWANADAWLASVGQRTHSQAADLLREAARCLEECAASIALLDARLLSLTGYPRECERGDVSRARSLVARIVEGRP